MLAPLYINSARPATLLAADPAGQDQGASAVRTETRAKDMPACRHDRKRAAAAELLAFSAACSRRRRHAPAAIVHHLNAAFNEALKSPEPSPSNG